MLRAEELSSLVSELLDEMKALDVMELDVSSKTDIVDYMVVATGTSKRHVSSIVQHLMRELKNRGEQPWGNKGRETADWVLLDLGDVLVHVMRKQARQFYQLERLWGTFEQSEAIG